MSLETDYFPAARIITNTKLPDLQGLKFAQKMNDSDINHARQIFQRIKNALREANIELSEQIQLTLSPQKSKIYLGNITSQSQQPKARNKKSITFII